VEEMERVSAQAPKLRNTCTDVTYSSLVSGTGLASDILAGLRLKLRTDLREHNKCSNQHILSQRALCLAAELRGKHVLHRANYSYYSNLSHYILTAGLFFVYLSNETKVGAAENKAPLETNETTTTTTWSAIEGDIRSTLLSPRILYIATQCLTFMATILAVLAKVYDFEHKAAHHEALTQGYRGLIDQADFLLLRAQLLDNDDFFPEFTHLETISQADDDRAVVSMGLDVLTLIEQCEKAAYMLGAADLARANALLKESEAPLISTLDSFLNSSYYLITACLSCNKPTNELSLNQGITACLLQHGTAVHQASIAKAQASEDEDMEAARTGVERDSEVQKYHDDDCKYTTKYHSEKNQKRIQEKDIQVEETYVVA
jgi:hypothetical protein